MRLDNDATPLPSTPSAPPPRRPDAVTSGSGAGPSPGTTAAVASSVDTDPETPHRRALLRAILATLDASVAVMVLFHLEVWLRALAALRPFLDTYRADDIGDAARMALFGRHGLHAFHGPARAFAFDAMRKAPREAAVAMARAATSELYKKLPGQEHTIAVAVTALFSEGTREVAMDIDAPPRWPSEALEDVIAVRAAMFPMPGASVEEGPRGSAASFSQTEDEDDDEEEESEDEDDGRRSDDARPRVVRAVLSTLAPVARRRFADAVRSYLDVLGAIATGRHVGEELRDAAGELTDDLVHYVQGEAVCAALFHGDPAEVLARDADKGRPSASDVAECADIFDAAVASFGGGRR